MGYLKINTNFAEILEPLQDAEIGRLFGAMLSYATNGTVPEFRGNERFVWNAAKQAIDRENEISAKRSEIGRSGGKQTQAKSSKAKQNQANAAQEKEAKRSIYINTPSRELSNLTWDSYNDTTSRNESMSSTTLTENTQETKGSTRSRKSSNSTVQDDFETFWHIYPTKKAKKDARKAWEKLKPSGELLKTILNAVEMQKQSKQWLEGYAPYPATWLNGERWNDQENKTQSVSFRHRDKYASEAYEQRTVTMDSLKDAIVDFGEEE